MKWIQITILAMVLSISVAGYATPQEYKGTPLKFYSDEIDQDFCFSQIDAVPEEYLEGVRAIKFFDKEVYFQGNRVLGRYFWGGVVEIYEACDTVTIIHELAHHQQYMRGDTLFNVITHTGHFQEYEEEIWQSIGE